MVTRPEHSFLQGDPEIAAQHDAALKSALRAGGEKMLILAVLEDAVDCYKRNLFAKDRKAQRLFAETEEWLLARDDKTMFAFENLCELLGVDADYLRAGIQRWKENQLAARRASMVSTSKYQGRKLRRGSRA